MKKKKRSLLSKKLFWLTLAVILVIIPLIGLIGSNFSNLVGKAVGDKAVQRIDIVRPGSKFFMEIRDVESLYLMRITFNGDGKNVVIEVEEGGIDWKPEGIVCSTFKIYSEYEDIIREIELTLKLKDEKIKELGLDRRDVKLYLDGKEIETSLDEVKEDYFYYTATVDSLGDFAFGKIKAIEEVEIPEQVEEVSETVPETEPEVIPEATEDKLPLAGKAAEGKFSEFMKWGISNNYWPIPIIILITIAILIFLWKRKK